MANLRFLNQFFKTIYSIKVIYLIILFTSCYCLYYYWYELHQYQMVFLFLLTGVSLTQILKPVYIEVPLNRGKVHHISIKGKSKEIVFKPELQQSGNRLYAIMLITKQFKRTDEKQMVPVKQEDKLYGWELEKTGVLLEEEMDKRHVQNFEHRLSHWQMLKVYNTLIDDDKYSPFNYVYILQVLESVNTTPIFSRLYWLIQIGKVKRLLKGFRRNLSLKKPSPTPIEVGAVD